MATAISNFKSALKNGGARPSLFEVSISTPSGITANGALTQDSIYRCSVSEIPGLTVTPIEQQYFGRVTKIPGDITFAGTFSTTFINSEDFSIHGALRGWMDLLNNDATNFYATGVHSVWAGTVRVTQYSKSGGSVIHYDYQDCWPSNISAIELSYDSASTIEEFTVTWEYNYFTVDMNETTTVDDIKKPINEID
jgi:hypothetical protein